MLSSGLYFFRDLLSDDTGGGTVSLMP
jgi:hypothetical protein